MQMQNSLKKSLCLMGIVLLIAGIASPQASGKDFPSKTITMIVPHGVGGGGDVAARILALGMQKELGATVIIKNVTGGGNITGLSALWKSKPDGYTIGMTYAQMACTTHIFEKVIYDPKKFSIIGRFVRSKYIMGVPKNSPFRSINDFKKSEKPIRVGVSHITSNSAIVLYALGKEMGFPVTFVSGYRGAAASIVGTFKGENDVVTYGTAVTPYLKSGELIPLLFFETEHSKYYPDVPCLTDFGLPEYLALLGSLDYVIWGPPGIAEDKLNILEKAMLKSTQENIERFENMGAYLNPLPGKEAKKVVSSVYDDFLRYKDITKGLYKK